MVVFCFVHGISKVIFVSAAVTRITSPTQIPSTLYFASLSILAIFLHVGYSSPLPTPSPPSSLKLPLKHKPCS